MTADLARSAHSVTVSLRRRAPVGLVSPARAGGRDSPVPPARPRRDEDSRDHPASVRLRPALDRHRRDAAEQHLRRAEARPWHAPWARSGVRCPPVPGAYVFGSSPAPRAGSRSCSGWVRRRARLSLDRRGVAAVAGHDAVDREQDDRAEDRGHPRADVEEVVQRMGAENGGGEKAADAALRRRR